MMLWLACLLSSIFSDIPTGNAVEYLMTELTTYCCRSGIIGSQANSAYIIERDVQTGQRVSVVLLISNNYAIIGDYNKKTVVLHIFLKEILIQQLQVEIHLVSKSILTIMSRILTIQIVNRIKLLN